LNSSSPSPVASPSIGEIKLEQSERDNPSNICKNLAYWLYVQNFKEQKVS